RSRRHRPIRADQHRPRRARASRKRSQGARRAAAHANVHETFPGPWHQCISGDQPMIRMFRPYYLSSRVIPALAAALLLVAPVAARVDDGTLFVRSAVENGDGTVTLPLYQGLSGGRTVYYVVLDASSGDTASRLGVNRSQKLANARGSLAVQKVTIQGETIVFPGTVDFSPMRFVRPGPDGFPPDVADPGAIADSNYSPLIELPDGTILNAPHVANDSGRADKVVAIDIARMRVTYRE